MDWHWHDEDTPNMRRNGLRQTALRLYPLHCIGSAITQGEAPNKTQSRHLCAPRGVSGASQAGLNIPKTPITTTGRLEEDHSSAPKKVGYSQGTTERSDRGFPHGTVPHSRRNWSSIKSCLRACPLCHHRRRSDLFLVAETAPPSATVVIALFYSTSPSLSRLRLFHLTSSPSHFTTSPSRRTTRSVSLTHFLHAYDLNLALVID